MKKKIIGIVLILALTLPFIVGCGSTATTTTAAPAGTTTAGTTTAGSGSLKDKKVTLVLKNNVNPFWVRVEEGAREGAKDLGINLTVLSPMTNDNNEEQMQLVEQAIVDKSDVIIIAPADSRGILPAARKATDAGIPVIDLNSKFAGDDMFWDTFVGLDNVDIGKQTMTRLAELLNGEGEIIMLEGVAGTESSSGRIAGAEEILKNYPNIKVVAKQAADWSRAKGMNVVQNLLPAYPNLKAVYSVNDEMAMGAIQALESANRLEGVLVTGADANADARQAIKDGKLTFSLDTNPFAQGYDSVQAAKDLLEGKKVEDFIKTEVKIIDKTNVG
jgi:ribose transport system substrate-binding protein